MNQSADLKQIQEALTQLANESEIDGIDYTVLNTRKDESGATVLAGDKFGLLRVAAHLVALARKSPGAHVHFDEHSELEECEVPLVLSRVPERDR